MTNNNIKAMHEKYVGKSVLLFNKHKATIIDVDELGVTVRFDENIETTTKKGDRYFYAHSFDLSFKLV